MGLWLEFMSPSQNSPMAKPIDLLRKVVVGDVSPLCHWFSHKNTQPRHATQHAHASNLFQTEHRTPTASCTPAYSFELPSVPGPSSLSDLWRNYPIRLSNSIPRWKPAQLHVQKYSLVALASQDGSISRGLPSSGRLSFQFRPGDSIIP